jgi:hypothetical protein
MDETGCSPFPVQARVARPGVLECLLVPRAISQQFRAGMIAEGGVGGASLLGAKRRRGAEKVLVTKAGDGGGGDGEHNMGGRVERLMCGPIKDGSSAGRPNREKAVAGSAFRSCCRRTAEVCPSKPIVRPRQDFHLDKYL